MSECSYKLTSYWKERDDSVCYIDKSFKVQKTIAVLLGDGVDYLDPELMDGCGKSRFIKILDQNILKRNETGITTEYGTEYGRDEINNAIEEFRTGRNPYNIVPQYYESDYTTDLCKVIGGNAFGILDGNEFISIKLKKCVDGNYSEGDIISALNYIYEEAKELKRPMAVYIPLETKLRLDSKNLTDIERTIRRLYELKGVIIITTTGSRSGNEHGFSASGLSELLEVISAAPYSDTFKGLSYNAGRINYKDFKTLSPILFFDSGASILCDDEVYTVFGAAVAGAIGTALVSAVLEWALADGAKKDILFEDVRIKLIEASKYGYVEDAGYGPIDIQKLNNILM